MEENLCKGKTNTITVAEVHLLPEQNQQSSSSGSCGETSTIATGKE